MNIKELIKNNKYICNSDNKNYMEITEFKDNKISICPQGGGFVKSIDIDNGKFIDDVVSKKIKFTNDMPMEWKKVKLFHDHWISDNNEIEHYIEGYVTNHKWNGWSIPMVELDQIKKFNKIQKKTLDSQFLWLKLIKLRNLIKSKKRLWTVNHHLFLKL